MISKKYYDLCVKSVSGNINPDEDKLLREWLLQSDENKNSYHEIKITWEGIGELKLPEIPNKEIEWVELQNRIKQDEENKSIYWSLRKIKHYFDFSRMPRYQPALIAFAFILFTVLTLVIFVDKEKKIINDKIITTKNSEKQIIELPDGSIVHLNMASKIEIPSDFNDDERNVNLEGEAFFEIVSNSKPFIVTTGNAQVKVLGTKFNIWARNEKTKVIVKEGRVNLTQKETATGGIELQGGFFSNVVGNNKPAQPVAVDAEYMIGWLNNKLVFEHTQLSEIVDELERLYNTDIILPALSLSDLTLTGRFDYSGLDSILEKICLALDLTYEYDDGVYTIKTKKAE